MNRVIRFVVIVAVALGVAYLRHQNRQKGTSSVAVPTQLASADTLAAAARAAHPTHLTRKLSDGTPPAVPTAGVFDLIKYPAVAGPTSAYLTPDPKDGKRHPAIVWITGGDCNSIGEVWGDADPANDQSASAYRSAGIAMMFPSLRGGNDSPGAKEMFFGEVDDVLAAADYLAGQPWVDPKRIYLGGHSTGGTLALLVSESTDRFRAVFSFGPVSNIRRYGEGLGPLPFDMSNEVEAALRSPGFWLKSVRTPTFVFEGQSEGNAIDLFWMKGQSTAMAALHWNVVPGKTHFSILYPANKLIAQKVLADTGATTNIQITDADVAAIASR